MLVKFIYGKCAVDLRKEKLIKHIVEKLSAELTLPDIVTIEFQKMGNSVYGETDISNKKITLNYELELNDILIPLTHELIHLEQIQVGKLAKSRSGEYVWENKPYKIQPNRLRYKEYKELPWESEIDKKQKLLLEKLLKN